MEYKVRRKVIKIGRKGSESLLVTLPKLWTEANGVVAGQFVEIVFNERLVVRPTARVVV